MADYGQATAGGYGLDAVCGLLVCTQGSATAWWDAGKVWSDKTQALIAGAESKGFPEATWPLGVQATRPQVDEIIALFNESPPWFAFYEDIHGWALKQQTLRDFCGELGTFLESKGLNPGKGPTDVPVTPSAIESALKLGGLAIAAYVAVNLLKAAKD